MSWGSGDAADDKFICSIAGAPDSSVEFKNPRVLFFCGLSSVEDYSTWKMSESVELKELSCIIFETVAFKNSEM